MNPSLYTLIIIKVIIKKQSVLSKFPMIRFENNLSINITCCVNEKRMLMNRKILLRLNLKYTFLNLKNSYIFPLYS